MQSAFPSIAYLCKKKAAKTAAFSKMTGKQEKRKQHDRFILIGRRNPLHVVSSFIHLIFSRISKQSMTYR